MRPIMNYDRATTQYNNKHDNVSSGHVHPSAAAWSPSNMVVIYYEQEYYRLASDELLSFFYNLLRDCLATTIITSTTSSETSPLSTSITEIRSSFISKQREDDRTYFCSLVADAQRRNRELEAKVNELGYQCCELMSRNKEYEEIHREQIILYNDNVWLKSEISRLKSLVEQQSEQLYERDCLLMTLDTELSEVKESNKQLFEAQKAEYRLRFETEHSLSEKVSFFGT
eukprot:PhM_4_TR11694/c0_g1_i3/m.23646